MPEKLILKLNALATALNEANEAFRDALAEHGIRTTKNYFSVVERKASLTQLLAADEADRCLFAALALSEAGLIQ